MTPQDRFCQTHKVSDGEGGGLIYRGLNDRGGILEMV